LRHAPGRKIAQPATLTAKHQRRRFTGTAHGGAAGLTTGATASGCGPGPGAAPRVGPEFDDADGCSGCLLSALLNVAAGVAKSDDLAALQRQLMDLLDAADGATEEKFLSCRMTRIPLSGTAQPREPRNGSSAALGRIPQPLYVSPDTLGGCMAWAKRALFDSLL
jgi:hypothetical protein